MTDSTSLPGSASQVESARLLLILDFDGVLNSFPKTKLTGPGPARHLVYPKDGRFFDDYQQFYHLVRFEDDPRFAGMDDRAYPITYSPEVIRRLAGLLADPRVQLLWLTSWMKLILPLAQELGLKAANAPAVINYPLTTSDWQSFKPEGLADFLTQVPDWQGSIIWVDDNFTVATRDGVSLKSRSKYPALGDFEQGARDLAADPIFASRVEHLLTLAPDSRYGLSRKDMDILDDFATEALGS